MWTSIVKSPPEISIWLMLLNMEEDIDESWFVVVKLLEWMIKTGLWGSGTKEKGTLNGWARDARRQWEQIHVRKRRCAAEFWYTCRIRPLLFTLPHLNRCIIVGRFALIWVAYPSSTRRHLADQVSARWQFSCSGKNLHSQIRMSS